MKNPLAWAVPAMLLLGACGEGPDRKRETESAVARKDPVAASEAGNEAVTPAPGAAPASGGGAALRFVGRWAAEEALCAGSAWRFTPDSLATPAGSRCTFEEVIPVSGGYDIAARCSAEGPPAEDRLKLRFAESAGALLFESDSIADAGLIYCGPLSG